MKTAACTHHVTYFCMKTKTSWSLCPSNFGEQLCWLYLSRDMAAWWRYRMETFSELLALCAGKSPHKGRWRGALMFFSALCLNKRLSKQSWGWWFETPSHPLWRHSDGYRYVQYIPWNIRMGWVLFLAATKQLYEWFSPSVRPSVCLSVTPFWLCYHHRIIMKFSGVITKDQGKVHAKGQGQRSKVKVTEVTTQLNRFRTVTPV